MQLRFRVNQAEAFRRGLSVPKSIVRVDVEPSELDQDTRDMIADRMEGIDVCYGKLDEKYIGAKPQWRDSDKSNGYGGYEQEPYLIEANADTFEALLEAVNADHNYLRDEAKQKGWPMPRPGASDGEV